MTIKELIDRIFDECNVAHRLRLCGDKTGN